jgi:sirohydrochlorin ferrochelatase
LTQAPVHRRVALLIAAHGERGGNGDNAGVWRLAEALKARGLVDEVGCGFIKGKPDISETLRAFAATEVVIYPLFASDGYFTRIRLPEILETEKTDKTIHVLPPLGLDPKLPDVILRHVRHCATSNGIDCQKAIAILLAHGSRHDPISRQAAEGMVEAIRRRGGLRGVEVAFLDEPPSLQQVLAEPEGPAIVVGLFCGDGVHGREDVPRQMEGTGRADIFLAGNISQFEEVAELIATAVSRALAVRLRPSRP